MPLLYQPKPGSIVICDFRGYVAPEMVKTRPVVVLAKSPTHPQLLTVVPISTTQPVPALACHIQLTTSPIPGNVVTCWAKCDMVATVALSRLDRVKVGHRQYDVPTLNPAELTAIKAAVAAALGVP